MKIHPLAILVFPLCASAFIQPLSKGHTFVKLHAQKDGDLLKPVAAAFAGLTIASQMAFGVLPAVASHPPPTVQERIASVESSGTLLSDFETLDFSLPSYSDTVNGGPGSKEATKATKEIPSFNPFGNIEVKETEQDLEKEAAKKSSESKAAEKKRKEQEAAEKKKEAAEEKARKAAEKEARVKAEKEKQRLAVERAREAKMAESAPAPAPAPVVPEPEPEPAPLVEDETPKFEAPKFEAPKFEAPKFDAPKFEAPKFEAPKFEAPKFEAPKFDTPKFDTPKFETPKFEAPKFDAPKIDAPKINIPSFEAPKISTPSLPAAKVDYNLDIGDEDEVEPQEVRDQRAREARTEYKEADKEAKEIERQAKVARDFANAKKKIANEKKDEACETRPGGKWICLRSPTIGY